MAAFVLFVLAVAGGVTVADLARENPAADQVTVFHHTVGGYPEGWLLATAAGLGFVVALLLVASVNSTKGRRARRQQLRGLRRGLEDQMVAPQLDHARLLDEFFGPEEPSRQLGGLARPADPRSEGPEIRPEDHQGWVTPRPIQHSIEPLYEQARRAAGLGQDWDRPVATSQGVGASGARRGPRRQGAATSPRPTDRVRA